MYAEVEDELLKYSHKSFSEVVYFSSPTLLHDPLKITTAHKRQHQTIK
jgi:hypothetical protein